MLLGKKNTNKLFLLTSIIIHRSDNLKTKRFYLRTAGHIFLVAAVCKKSVSFSARVEMESFLNWYEVFTEFEKQFTLFQIVEKTKLQEKTWKRRPIKQPKQNYFYNLSFSS